MPTMPHPCEGDTPNYAEKNNCTVLKQCYDEICVKGCVYDAPQMLARPAGGEATDKPSALSVFDAMLKAGMINKERGETYGHPTDNFSLIQNLKRHVRNCKDPVAREALESICIKIARLVQTWDHIDSWGDIAGYARAAVMHIDRVRNRDKSV